MLTLAVPLNDKVPLGVVTGTLIVKLEFNFTVLLVISLPSAS